jgi:hypothetical protein
MTEKKPSAIDLTDEDITDYLYCPFKYYLKKIGQLPAVAKAMQVDLKSAGFLRSTIVLPGRILSEALSLLASGKYGADLYGITRALWRSWLLSYPNVHKETVKTMMLYGEARNKILQPYFSGERLTRERKKYVEPRMSNSFKREMKDANLPELAARVDKELLEATHYSQGELQKLGAYRVSDAFADSLIMAERFPRIEPAQIVAANEYRKVTLESGRQISFRIDVLYQQGGNCILEVHDPHPAFVPQHIWSTRDIRSILGSFFLESNGDKNDILLHRHLISGKSKTLRNLRSARAVLGVEYVLNGIFNDVFYPAFLSGDLNRCRACLARSVCLSGDAANWVLPGIETSGERLRLAAAMLQGKKLDKTTLDELERVLQATHALPTGVLRAEIQRLSNKTK